MRTRHYKRVSCGMRMQPPLKKGFFSPSDATTATSTIVSLVDNKNPTLSSTWAADEYESNLLATITKHREDILQLFQAGTGSGKSTIPPKMPRKVRAANMTSMTQANSLIACAGGMKLSSKRLKELGSNAELEAKELHNVEVAEQNEMDHGTVSDHTEEMETKPEIAITEPEVPAEHQMKHEPQEEDMSQDQDPDGFWRTTIPERTQILTMANNGNCFF